MMIAIKDMKMPTECEYCGFCRYYPENGNVWCNANNRILKLHWKDANWTHLDVERPDWCPLIEIKTDGDTISRQAAIDVVEESRRLNNHKDGKAACCHEYEHRHFLKILHELPPVQPEIKTGRWEYVDYGGVGNYHCTVCGKICICNGDYDFCPSCDAKILKDGESDDS